MNFFRKPQDILRRSEGSYVNGRWVNGGALVPDTIMASVQPASLSDYNMLQAEPGGRRIEKLVRVYTSDVVSVAGEDDTNGDILLWEGDKYLFIAVSPWHSTALAHNRYWASKVLEGGSDDTG